MAAKKPVVDYSSQLAGTQCKAANVTSGSVNEQCKGWMTQMGNGNQPDGSEYVVIDLGSVFNIKAFGYLNEFDSSFRNAKEYQLLGSVDGSFDDAVILAEGTLPQLFVAEEWKVKTDPSDVRYVKFVAQSAYERNGQAILAVGDIKLYDTVISGESFDDDTLNPVPLRADYSMENVLQGKPVTGSSSSLASFAPENINDGDTGSTWRSQSGQVSGRNEWVSFDLGNEYTIDRLEIVNNTGHYTAVQSYRIYGSDTGEFAGEEFLMVEDTTDLVPQGVPYEHLLTHPAAARYIKFVGLSAGGFRTYTTDTINVSELRFYGTPYVPQEENHIVTVAGGSGSGKYALGDEVTITADIPAGKKFAGWAATGMELTEEEKMMNPLTFVMPNGEVSLTANFEDIAAPADEYLVTVAGGSGSGEYALGDEVTITADIPAGKKFAGWTATGMELTEEEKMANPLIFIMPNGNLTLTAKFESNGEPPRPSNSISFDKYSIYAQASQGGTITPEGETRVKRGDSVTFKITPAAGYRIDKVWVDGNKEVTLENGKYTFENVEQPYSIEVVFVKTDSGKDAVPVAPQVPNPATGDNNQIWPIFLLALAGGVLGAFKKRISK